MELRCEVKNYAWGKYSDGIVADLLGSSNKNCTINEKMPYAELWMGTHPSGPSFLKETDISLDDYIKQNNDVLGPKVLEKFGPQLPFLFKVLSVNKALSIQVHPNKTQAEKLHQSNPEIYKDSNHKPEMAIALTPFEVLCGFRPIREIEVYLRLIPELRVILGDEDLLELTTGSEADPELGLKKCFANLMSCDKEIIDDQLKRLVERIAISDQSTREMLNADLLERIYADFVGDVGCFGIYFFNYIVLQPEEAIYLPPNEPHAYLYGDCIECMACSDNVIRAGLTPKPKDTKTLLGMLNYKCEMGLTKKFQSSREDDYSEIFRPPVPDFAVTKILIPPGRATCSLIPRNVGSILIIIKGKTEIVSGSSAKILNRGSVLFIGANEHINMKILCGCHPTLMFQAFANV